MRRLVLAVALLIGAACDDQSTSRRVGEHPDAHSSLPPRTTIDERPAPASTPHPSVEPPAADCVDVEGAPRVERLGFAPGFTLISDDVARVERELDGMAAAGVCWMRIDIDWSRIEVEERRFRWDATDRAVLGAREREMQVLAMIAYTPAWARPDGTTDKHPPTDPGTFARFASEVVRRYQPAGVRTWEIWNEPNISAFWMPQPDPIAYGELLRVTTDAIRGVDPAAVIVSAGLSPASDNETNVAPLTFLDALYHGGYADAFDAVGFHPYSYPLSPIDEQPLNHFVTITPQIRELMESHGDADAAVWATEFGAPTGTSDQAVSPETQAQYLAEAIDQWNQWEWTGPLFVYSWRDRGTDPEDREQNFGLVDHEERPKPALHTLLAYTGGRPPP